MLANCVGGVLVRNGLAVWYAHVRSRVAQLRRHIRMDKLSLAELWTKEFEHSSMGVVGGLAHKREAVRIAGSPVHCDKRIALPLDGRRYGQH